VRVRETGCVPKCSEVYEAAKTQFTKPSVVVRITQLISGHPSVICCGWQSATASNRLYNVRRLSRRASLLKAACKVRWLTAVDGWLTLSLDYR